MLSPKTITTKQSVSLGLQSLGLRVFLIWFSLTILVLGASVTLISHNLSDQRTTQTMTLLGQEALVMRDLTQVAAPADSVSNLSLPTFHHVGNYYSATQSAHWPKDCPPRKSPPVYGSPFKSPCDQGANLIGVRLKMSHSVDNGEDLLVWTLLDPPKYVLLPSVATMVAAMLLFAALALFGSRALARSMTQHLQQISKGIVRISEGDYQYRISASKLAEIDSVIQAFNAMGQVMEERDRFFRQTAFVDSLSGLDNRAFLLLTLRNRIQQAAEPLCVLTWSVGNLSEIHDALGQEIVDSVLKKIAKKARRVSPAHLSLARLEGNVFAIVVPANLFNALP
ncbi:MAG: adenylate/guanylate cyclase domain-containing protein, partial [Limnobacter sp.]|nr:adenylate/guanylate cyclase domain-containing protein [Limnobacter sp.]